MAQSRSSQLVVQSLMPTNDLTVVRDGFKAEAMRIRVSTDPDKKEIYKVGYSDGKEWYGMTKIVLDKLQIAAAIITDDVTVTKSGMAMWVGRWEGRYLTPAGIEVPLKDEYEFDCEIGGSRWRQKVDAEIAWYYSKKKGANNLHSNIVAQMHNEAPEEEHNSVQANAEATATRYVNELAMYGRQRAVTGAQSRAMRRFFQIRTYTKAELDNTVFEIMRVRIDDAAMAVQIGDQNYKALQFAKLAQSMLPGLDTQRLLEEVIRSGKQIDAQDLENLQDIATDDFGDMGDMGDIIEGEQCDPAVEGEEEPSEPEMTKEDFGKVRAALADYYKPYAVQEKTVAAWLEQIWGTPPVLTPRHAALAVQVIQKCTLARDALGDKPTKEAVKQSVETVLERYIPIARQFYSEGGSIEIPDIEQMELPGVA